MVAEVLRNYIDTHRMHGRLTRSKRSENGMGQHYTDPNHPVVRRAVQLAQETDAKDVLDLGTGRGLVPLALAKETGVKNVFATDINEVALQELKQKARKRQKGTWIFPRVFNAALTLPERWKEQFDMVVAKDVLPFLKPDMLPLFLKNIADAVKPGGWVLLTAPATRSRLYEEAVPFDNPNGDFSRQLGDNAKEFIQTSVESFNFETPKHFAEELEEVGLELTEIQPYGREKGWLWAVAQKEG